jgi:ribosomal 50S subunit-recycling heat shock protein
MSNHKKNSNKHRVRFLPKKANIVDYCARNFSIFKNKMAVEKAIEKEEISLNGNAATPEDFVRNGDFILVQKEEKIQPKESFPERNKKRTKKPKFDIEMPIVYEEIKRLKTLSKVNIKEAQNQMLYHRLWLLTD